MQNDSGGLANKLSLCIVRKFVKENWLKENLSRKANKTFLQLRMREIQDFAHLLKMTFLLDR